MRVPTLLLAGALLVASHASAFEVSSLPYQGTPDWVDIVFDGTSMVRNPAGTQTTLSTAQSRGVWFGNGSGYSNAANWSMGSPAAGNYLSLTAKFSAGAADWSAYMSDTTHGAFFAFAPTGCADNCYSTPAQAGIRFYYSDGGNSSASTFVPLDLTQFHTYEWLVKGGRVDYRIDGQFVFSGAAYQSVLDNPLLVIGDGSGPTQTGLGSMTITSVTWDTAPAMNSLAPIPEPETYALMLAGLGLVGWAARRGKR
jgi:hypothetical protein